MSETKPWGETHTMRAQIEELIVGESWAKAVRLDGNEPGLADRLNDIIRSMRSSIQPTVYRIQTDHAKQGRSYTIEQIEGRTGSKDELVVLVVTRLK